MREIRFNDNKIVFLKNKYCMFDEKARLHITASDKMSCS